MRLRTFVGLSVAAILVAGNTALLLWLKGRARRPAPGTPRVEALTPPDEARATPRAPTAAEAAVLDGSAASAPADLPRLRIVVTDSAGSPLEGARVRVEGELRDRTSPFREPPLAEGESGPDGVLEVVLARRARVRVVAERPGYAPSHVQEAAGPEVRIRLHREGVLRGRVLEEATGGPLPGATVRVGGISGPPVEVTTDADGSFVLRGLMYGSIPVEALSDLHPPIRKEVAVPAGGEGSVELHLRRGRVLRGRVVFAGSDRRVEEGTVSCAGATHPYGIGSFPRTAPLGPDGRFELRGLSDFPREFRVTTGGAVFRATGQVPTTDPATGEQVGEIVVALPANNPEGIPFQGVVRDEDGRPVEGARVTVGTAVLENTANRYPEIAEVEDSWRPQCRTDAEGRYRIVSEHGGNEVLVVHPDYAPTHFVLPYRSRNRTFDLALVRGATVLVTVRDSSGRPAAGAEVAALLRNPDPAVAFRKFGEVHAGIRSRPLTDREGRATLPRLGPGSWYLAAVSAGGVEGGRVVLDLERGAKDAAADLVLGLLPRAAGRVKDSSGSPVANAWVNAADADLMGRQPYTTSGADGKFVLPALLPLPAWDSMGGVPVYASSRSVGRNPEPVVVPYDGEADVRIQMGGAFLR